MRGIYLGIDPSLTSTGVALLYTDDPVNPKVYVTAIRAGKPGMDLAQVVACGREQTRLLHEFLLKYPEPIRGVIQEYPPPVGQSCPMLFGIGAMLASYWDSRGVPVLFAHPSTLKSLVGTGNKYDKADVKALLGNLGVTVCDAETAGPKLTKKILTDEADAALLLLYLAHNCGAAKIRLPSHLDPAKWVLKDA